MLTSLWDLSNLPPNVKAVIGVPRAAMTARPSDRAPIEQRIASTLGVLVGQVLALSRGGTRPNRSFRFLVLPGTALALVGLAVFGLRFSSAEIGPKAPPLTDLEAALSGPDPLMTKVAARTDSPAAPSPRFTPACRKTWARPRAQPWRSKPNRPPSTGWSTCGAAIP